MGPERVFSGQSVEAPTGDREAAQILISEAAILNSGFQNFPHELVGYSIS